MFLLQELRNFFGPCDSFENSYFELTIIIQWSSINYAFLELGVPPASKYLW